MKSFRELRVWQAAMNLVEKVYMLTHAFPKEETYGPVKEVLNDISSLGKQIYALRNALVRN